METESPYMPVVLKTPKSAFEVGAPFAPTLFLPVSVGLLPFVRGMLLNLDNPRYWLGTDAEIEAARVAIRLQASEAVKTQADVCGTPLEWGALFSGRGGVLGVEQGEGLPVPPWEFTAQYIEEALWLLYRTEGSEMTWIPITELPKGDQGEPGADGADGVDGVDGADGADGVDGADGADGEPGLIMYQQISNRFIDGSAPYGVMFTGQYFLQNRIEGTFEPQGEVFDFGLPVYAPQGLPGEQGIPGEQGVPGEGLTVITQQPSTLPSVQDRRLWYYVALEVVAVYQDLLETVNSEAFPAFARTLYRAASFFAPVQQMYDLFGGLTPEMEEAMRGTAAQLVAANILYCEWMNHVKLSNSEIQLISTALGDPRDTIDNTALAGECLAAAVMWCAASTAAESEQLRNLIKSMRLKAVGLDELPPDPALPCAPVVEQWQHVIDLTIDNGGLLSGIVGWGGQARYVPGKGWQANVDYDIFGVRLEFPASCELTEIEVLFSDAIPRVYNLWSGGAVGQSPVIVAYEEPEFPQAYLALRWVAQPGTLVVATIAVSSFLDVGDTTMARISLAGNGLNPFM